MNRLNVGVGVKGDKNNTLQNPINLLESFNIDVYPGKLVNVVCDVQNLPFQNKVFEFALCSHVLEHLDQPARAFKELLRVTKNCLEIEVPHRLGNLAKDPYHKCSFKKAWFVKICKQANVKNCIRVLWEFPLNLNIHIWIYPSV